MFERQNIVRIRSKVFTSQTRILKLAGFHCFSSSSLISILIPIVNNAHTGLFVSLFILAASWSARAPGRDRYGLSTACRTPKFCSVITLLSIAGCKMVQRLLILETTESLFCLRFSEMWQAFSFSHKKIFSHGKIVLFSSPNLEAGTVPKASCSFPLQTGPASCLQSTLCFFFPSVRFDLGACGICDQHTTANGLSLITIHFVYRILLYSNY